jgi:peptidylprolyl isomerase
MKQVKKGDKVKVHYTGRLLDGPQCDSSAGRAPLEFVVGEGQMIKGFDTGVEGMAIGEKKTLQISPNDAYGERDEERIIEFPLSNVPEDMKLSPGMQLTLRDQHGNPVPVTVAELKEDLVILDANHFLAGKDLVFDIEVVEIG